MLHLEIPIKPIAPHLIAPSYANRQLWVEMQRLRRPTVSDPPMLIGSLSLTQEFSADWTSGHGTRYKKRLNIGTSDASRDISLRFTYRRDSHSAHYEELPPYIAQFAEAITLIAAHEHGAYPGATYENIGISIDQMVITPGSAQRSGGRIHRDGNGRNPRWSHIYVVSDQMPTEYFPGVQAFEPAQLPPNIDALAVSAVPYDITYANISTYHRSPVCQAGGARTFLRMTYVHELPSQA